MKLSGYTDNGIMIKLLNSPGGSTLQWGTGQRLLTLTLLVWTIFCSAAAQGI